MTDLRCIKLSSIKVKYILNNQAVNAHRDVLLDGDTLYTSIANQSQIAVEFAKYFGQIDELDTFVHLLFSEKSPENIEDFLKQKKIPNLPCDEEEWLHSPRLEEKIEKTDVSVQSKEEIEGGKLVTPPPLPDPIEKFPDQKEFSLKLGDVKQETAPEPVSPPTLNTHTTTVNASGTTHRSKPGETTKQFQHETPEKDLKAQARSSEREHEDVATLLAKKPESVKLFYATFSPRQRRDLLADQNRGKLPEKFERGEKYSKPERQISDKQWREIGHWGEQVVYYNLKREMQERYKDASIIDTEDGFTIKKNDQSIAEVVWNNKIQENSNRRYGHDIKIIEDGVSNYIEVKSSVKPKQTFMVTKNEWELAKITGDNYFIYYVYHSPQENLIICEKIQNPIEKWKQDELDASIIQIQF